MNKLHKKTVIIKLTSILAAFLLASCSPAIKYTPTTFIDPTAHPTQSPTSIFPLVPSPSRTSTPIPTLTPTITYIPYPYSPLLQGLMISTNDLESSDFQNERFINDIYIFFYYEGTLLVFDKSNDVKSTCLIECTKQVWSRSPQSLVISMVRMNDEQDAIDEASALYNDLKPFYYEYEGDELESLDDLPPNSHLGISKLNNQLVLTTSRGPIVLKVELFPPFGDNATIPPIIIIAFTNLQINKLKQANVIP